MNRRIKSNLRTLLNERNIEQKELAEITGLSVRTISELANDKMKHYPKKALESIVNALNIDDLNDILTIEYDNNDDK